jgi:hypothetical protein
MDAGRFFNRLLTTGVMIDLPAWKRNDRAYCLMNFSKSVFSGPVIFIT